jgi:5-(carboxyamino)imidazole ribonucleotide mutase
MSKAKVGIIMGSDSDLPVMQDAANVLAQLDVPFELTIVSAHRTPERMMEYATSAEHRGLHVIIAGAGGAAHLPGMVAAMTTLPVIGVPIQSKSLKGLDSLLSIVQMPGGIPVATVAIQGARNAGLLAARMLSPYDLALRKRLVAFHQTMHDAVVEKVEKLDDMGYESYLEAKEHRNKI